MNDSIDGWFGWISALFAGYGYGSLLMRLRVTDEADY